MLRKFMIALVAALTFSAAMAEAQAFGFRSSRSSQAPEAGAPLAYQLYCLQHPADCRSSRRSVVAYTPKIRALLVSVNNEVNRAIRPRNERGDTWSLNPAYGDCDDYVMTKRHRLLRAGLPASALRVAVVRTKSGVGHAVLIVRTSAGDFALDNLRKTILRRHQTGYRFLQMV